MIERDPSTLIGRDLSVQTPLSSFLAATGNSELVLVAPSTCLPCLPAHFAQALPCFPNLKTSPLSRTIREGGPPLFFCPQLTKQCHAIRVGRAYVPLFSFFPFLPSRRDLPLQIPTSRFPLAIPSQASGAHLGYLIIWYRGGP